MNVHVQIIPHADQRYRTSGDYWWEKHGTLQIRVSDMGNHEAEQLVAIHEYCEAVLCQARGITDDQISGFDKEYEAARDDPKCFDAEQQHFFFRGTWCDMEAEPGDHPEAPYQREHCLATSVERMLCAELGLTWEAYSCANALLEG